MKSGLSIAAALATLLLHVVLVVAIGLGLSGKHTIPPQPLPIVVELLPPSAEAEASPTPPIPAISAPSPQREKQKQHKPVIKPKPVAPSRTAKPEAQPESTTAVAKPAPSPAASESASVKSGQQMTSSGPSKTEPSIPASYAASNRKPTYPPISRRAEEEGTVILRVLVKADGSAGEVNVKTSSGYPLLDESAKKTVKTWRFNPATSNGQPIAEWYEVPVPFKLVD